MCEEQVIWLNGTVITHSLTGLAPLEAENPPSLRFLEGGLAFVINVFISLPKLREMVIWLQNHARIHLFICMPLIPTSSAFASRPLLLLLFSQVVSDSFVSLWTLAHQAPLSAGFSFPLALF